jgi:hypothetical protein
MVAADFVSRHERHADGGTVESGRGQGRVSERPPAAGFEEPSLMDGSDRARTDGSESRPYLTGRLTYITGG